MTTTSAKIICDSISPDGFRLVTFECGFPRIVLAEVNTHRQLNRVSASSRAIKIEAMLKKARTDPYVPIHWGKNQKGMQAEEDISPDDAHVASMIWRDALTCAARHVEELAGISGGRFSVHKQITNRLLEPFMWHTAVITATEWSNFFHLRDHKAAHPDFRDLAAAMHELYRKHEPTEIGYKSWHLPYIDDNDPLWAEAEIERICRISVGRCARVSFDRLHEEETSEKAKARCDMMRDAGHMSPFEHVARPMSVYELELFKQKKLRWNTDRKGWDWVGAEFHDMTFDNGVGVESRLVKEGEHTHFLGPVQGWVQYRKTIPFEEDILGARE